MIEAWAQLCERVFGSGPASQTVGEKVRENQGQGLGGVTEVMASEPPVEKEVDAVRDVGLGL